MIRQHDIGHMPFPGHRTQAEVRVDSFWEEVSRDGDVARAASVIGESPEWGFNEFRSLARKMGVAA